MRIFRILFGSSVLTLVIVAALADTSLLSEGKPNSTKSAAIQDDTGQPTISPTPENSNATEVRKTRRKASTRLRHEEQTHTNPQNASPESPETTATSPVPEGQISTLPAKTAKTEMKSNRTKTSSSKKSNRTVHETSEKGVELESPSSYKPFIHRITTPKLFDSLFKSSVKIEDSEPKKRKKPKKKEPEPWTDVADGNDSGGEANGDDSGSDDFDSTAYDEYEDDDESEASNGSVDYKEKPTKLKKPKKTLHEKKRMMKKQKKKEKKRNQAERLLWLSQNSSDSGERRRASQKLQEKEDRRKAWLERMNGTDGNVNTSTAVRTERPKKKNKLPDFVEGKGWIDDAGDLKKYLEKSSPSAEVVEGEQPQSRRSRARERDARDEREQGFSNDRGGRGYSDRRSYGGRGDGNDRYRGSRFGTNDRRDDRYGRNDRGRFDRRDDRNDRRDNRYERNDRDRFDRRDNRNDPYRKDDRNDRYGSGRRSDSWRGRDDRYGSGRQSGYGRGDDRNDRYKGSSFRRDGDRRNYGAGRRYDTGVKSDGKGYGGGRGVTRNEENTRDPKGKMKLLASDEAEKRRRRLILESRVESKEDQS